MDPNNVPQPNLNLPQPMSHEGQGGVDPSRYLEHQAGQQQSELPQSSPAPAPQLPTNPLMSQAPAAPQAAAPPLPLPAAQPTVPPIDDLPAEDIDLIEKQWVLKAKAIVDSTRNDPREQNIELSKIKAEYIKKRYNKDVKVSE